MTGAPEQPRLASMAIMIREDGRVLALRQAAGPFAGRWSMPFLGVASNETAEDALDRLLREVLHVEPGPYEFLDTLYVEGSGGERFVLNAFTCIDWQGEPRYARGIYDDAVWAPPGDPGSLELVPEVRDWLRSAFEAETASWGVDYDAGELRRALTEARGDLIAAYESLPSHLRGDPLEEDWSPHDVLAHTVDVEAYSIAEVRRACERPGHTWRPFNDAQWLDLRRLRPAEDEMTIRERMDSVRTATLEWLEEAGPGMLALYVNHPDRGVVQPGDRIDAIVRQDREHSGRLRRMAQAAAVGRAADPQGGRREEDQGNDAAPHR